MPLHLRVTSDNRTLFGDHQTIEFEARGGTLGRSVDNDWVFPDPHRYVSGHHALIDFQGGAYYLVDTSRNGVYINKADAPVGSGHPQRIFDGDILRVGDYEITVKITPDDENMADDSMRDSVVRAQLVPEDESVEMQLVDEKRMVEDESLERYLAEGSAEYSQLSEKVPAISDVGPSRVADMKALQQAAGLLLKSAGLKPTELVGRDPSAILRTAGAILREMVAGLTTLLRERAELKATFRLAQTSIQAGNDNPLKFSPTTDDALKYLLDEGSGNYLPGVNAVRTSFEEINNHEQAVPKALVQAMKDFMEHFAPEELRQQFDHGLKHNGLLGRLNKRKYWELYEESFATLTAGDEGTLPDAFSQEFARAYKEQFDAVKSAGGK